MKPHLLLLHGALGTKNQFIALQKKLKSDFEIHTFNFAGHGSNTLDKEFTMPIFVNDVIDYLMTNNLKYVHVFGYSMGGYVALNAVLKHPEFFDKIVTLGTKFNWTKESAEAETKMLNPEKMEEKVPAFAKILEINHTQNNWKQVVRKTAAMMHGLGNGERLKNEELESIQHHVLVCIGSEDSMVSIEESKKSADILPNGTLEILSGFQHPIEKVDIDILRSVIFNFIT